MALYNSLIRKLLFRFPSETVHEFGIKALEIGLGPQFIRKIIEKKFACNEFGQLQRFGLNFANPVGIAAGFDKNGVIANQLFALGFGFLEIGTVTLDPQPGNPRPRLFRLPLDQALINRAGFNNEGTAAAVDRLKRRRPNCVLGVNIGKNKDVLNEDAIGNYVSSLDLAHEVADYVAINVSSPNTPNLRELQKADALESLLHALQRRNSELNQTHHKNLPLLVKIAPDLEEGEIESIVDISLRLDFAGIIATNTTISRTGLRTPARTVEKIGSGGLSGKPLGKQSNEVIKKIFQYSKGKLPIIGVGGIFHAEDAFEKVVCGASLLQGYTGFVYRGIGFARDINFGLAAILKERGFKHLDEAVGSDGK